MIPAWSDDMMKNWSDAQKRYWDAWADLSKMGQPGIAAQPAMPDWTQGLDQWWKAVSPHTVPGASTDAFQRMVDMGKVYMNLAESTYKVRQAGATGAEAIEAWMNSMESGFQSCCANLDAGKFSAHGFGAGQALLDSWQRVTKSLGMEAFQKMGAGGFQMPMSQNWQEQLDKLLGTPAIGYNRESQERLQALTQLGANYQEALDDYLKAFAKQGLESVNALRARVASLREEGKSISSLRELYDLWVDVNEEVYGKFAMTDEYQVVYGDLVNALMAFKQGVNAEMDSIYEAANLPTRKELNAAFQKQQEARREIRALRQQVQELSRKLDALSAVASAPAAAPAPVAEVAPATEPVAEAAPPAKPARRSKKA
ncbi:MAG TPA: class III poly(R)-hydroxyalkanoic acid synthase subunit PhaE [Candidatus Thiothrix moscowensis]|uniref:class III poly(R)-hydroxyalkanoic acid synthase subunit PhaE n=1 Tax=unclassified Thiothrix TaxID=2636184 RepID=UPI0025F1268D|nr:MULTISPECIES: class III poly(R)-hydroxyalkanoic acid synthase subunit PhaE [unclassified Thiothrix]HRJ52905.1 class III poly(R)-hydroxyalkanoic acid synthase subunit PhaE [Candidatus Thiothrix moscowensis]HRJ93455.1 class III poly(R)-hydroxyalkanoic acid synthase subunit PhaE [Candidatus Thiothrix moscowensis]